MKNLIKAVVIVGGLAAFASPAAAGGQGRTFGLGAEVQLSDVAGLSANYDFGPFHVGALLAFSDFDGPNNTTVALGGRFYYHLHSTAMSDFGVGGQIGLVNSHPNPAFSDSQTAVFLEPGFQLRAFVANNVALSFAGGLVLGLADANGLAVGGQTVFSGGVHYYFF